MKNTILKTMSLLGVALLTTQCTGDFENQNTNPYGITDQSLEQDFNDIGAYIPNITRMIVNTTNYRYQIAQNLCSDSWAGYFAPPTAFAGGTNNTTYKMTWRDHTWLSTYESIMSPAKQVIEKAETQGREHFVVWIKLIRMLGMQRLTSLHGPVIYSQYGISSTTSLYDSEEALYNTFFAELDEIQEILKQNDDFEGFTKFDVAYGGDIKKWIKLSNTLRLQLAIRIVKINPTLAQTQAEKAYNDSYGLITTNTDNFNVNLGGEVHPIYTISEGWGDTRMSATMESFLVGYEDNRIGAFFSPVSNNDIAELVSDHPDFPYKGIKNGATLVAKDLRTSYSKAGTFFATTTHHTLINASMVNFMLSEAALRGWNVGGTAKDYYEQGVKTSFEQWGTSGVDTYLANATNTPINYVDPKASSATENAFDAQTDITIAWQDSDTNERKLERIITQKWIAGFPDSYEAWVDFRRTGYPKIEPIYQNDSNATDGIIPNGQHIRRMNFVQSEYDSNASGVTDAIQKLGGEDKISTRLWWDVDAPNF